MPQSGYATLVLGTVRRSASTGTGRWDTLRGNGLSTNADRLAASLPAVTSARSHYASVTETEELSLAHRAIATLTFTVRKTRYFIPGTMLFYTITMYVEPKQSQL